MRSRQIIHLRLIPRMVLVKHAGVLVEQCFGECVVKHLNRASFYYIFKG